jgi:hypothetical protein
MDPQLFRIDFLVLTEIMAGFDSRRASREVHQATWGDLRV